MTTDVHSPLAETLVPARDNRLLRNAVLAIAGVALLTASAKVQVPFWPVPMTMQTYVVLVLGAMYGARLGAATVVLYLLVGALGAPVFANSPERGIGLAYMMGPTGGYLAGFVAAAWLAGWLAERGWDRSVVRLLVAMAAAHLVIFAFGWSWLATLIGPTKAWVAGVAPFYLATVFKTLLGAVTLPAIWTLLDARQPKG